MPKCAPELKEHSLPQDLSSVHICTEMPVVDHAKSLQVALQENSANLLFNPSPSAVLSVDAPAIAVVFKKAWKPGRTLRIRFLNVSNSVSQRIKQHAERWLEVVNLRFEWVSDGLSDIRIGTTPGGSWSYIGTDALTIPADQPTMNYGWLTDQTGDVEYNRVVLHEFGHALGAIHEHQHPGVNIPWDREKVYEYYRRTNGWDRPTVDVNIFQKYDFSQLNASRYDRDSIMHYAVPNELTIGDFEVGWNTELSSSDRTFMTKQYPKPGSDSSGGLTGDGNGLVTPQAIGETELELKKVIAAESAAITRVYMDKLNDLSMLEINSRTFLEGVIRSMRRELQA